VADRARFRVQIEEVGRRFQQANGLTGRIQLRTDHLWELGELEQEGRTVAVLLGLWGGPHLADRLRAVRSHARGRESRWLVVVPGLQLEPLVGEALRGQGIYPVPLDVADLWHLDVRDVLGIPRPRPAIVLTAEELARVQEHGLRGALQVELLGLAEADRVNVLLVDGQPCTMTDAPLYLFLQLLRGLLEEPNG
jgi:hypothetical protein